MSENMAVQGIAVLQSSSVLVLCCSAVQCGVMQCSVRSGMQMSFKKIFQKRQVLLGTVQSCAAVNRIILSPTSRRDWNPCLTICAGWRSIRLSSLSTYAQPCPATPCARENHGHRQQQSCTCQLPKADNVSYHINTRTAFHCAPGTKQLSDESREQRWNKFTRRIYHDLRRSPRSYFAVVRCYARSVYQLRI